MPFQPGNKLAKGGRADKPFADALRIELAAAGKDHKALRSIARNLIKLAQKAELTALPAINAVADRLDGKPAQESTVTFIRDVNELTDGEIAARIAELRGGIRAPDGDDAPPVNPSKLN